MIVAQATGGTHYSNPSTAIISSSSSTASAAAAPPHEGFFIFPESEFEGELFHTPSLITKYRKVVSLEALREQLLAYSGALKQQLYTIINRDYKDFITISTKVAMIIMVIVLMMTIMIDDGDGSDNGCDDGCDDGSDTGSDDE
jgi:hypothetical protein